MLLLDENDSFKKPKWHASLMIDSRDYNPLSCAQRSVHLYKTTCLSRLFHIAANKRRNHFLQILDLLKVMNLRKIQPVHIAGRAFLGEIWYSRTLFLR